VAGLVALLPAACAGDEAGPAWLEACTDPLDPVVDAPSMTFAPAGLRPIRAGTPREGLVQVVGQIESTVPEQSELVIALAEELGMEEVFAENEGTDAEYTYSDGETLYLVTMRQQCVGRLEMRFNEERDPAAEP
jgi:hypothetical protein